MTGPGSRGSVGRARVARKDTIHVGHPLIPEFPRGCLDVDWIPAVAARGLMAIAWESPSNAYLRSGLRISSVPRGPRLLSAEHATSVSPPSQ